MGGAGTPRAGDHLVDGVPHLPVEVSGRRGAVRDDSGRITRTTRTHLRREVDTGDAAHGASVHFVTAELDGGPLIAQVRIATMPDDTAESLAARLLPCEHELLVACVAEIASGRIRLDGQRVLRDGEPQARPLEHAAGKLVASAA